MNIELLDAELSRLGREGYNPGWTRWVESHRIGVERSFGALRDAAWRHLVKERGVPFALSHPGDNGFPPLTRITTKHEFDVSVPLPGAYESWEVTRFSPWVAEWVNCVSCRINDLVSLLSLIIGDAREARPVIQPYRETPENQDTILKAPNYRGEVPLNGLCKTCLTTQCRCGRRLSLNRVQLRRLRSLVPIGACEVCSGIGLEGILPDKPARPDLVKLSRASVHVLKETK